MSHLSMCDVMTMVSMCGNDTSLISASVKVNLAVVFTPSLLVLEV
jgi:hypothetical protein